MATDLVTLLSQNLTNTQVLMTEDVGAINSNFVVLEEQVTGSDFLVRKKRLLNNSFIANKSTADGRDVVDDQGGQWVTL